MNAVRAEAPSENLHLRQAVYRGQIFRLASVSASRELVATVVSLVEDALGADCRRAQFQISRAELLDHVAALKKKVYEQPAIRETVKRIISEKGFDVGHLAFDPPRFRGVIHGGHEHVKAGPAYSAHRDTWYGNPQAQINWWIPLHDLSEGETFLFYPEAFDAPMTNTSSQFHYDEWIVKVGFGRSYCGNDALYPTVPDAELVSLKPLGFSCRAGDIIMFSGSHLHRTKENSSGLTRFSMDFRTVDLDDDARGIGAPNVDNGSRGSALKDYVHRE